MDEKQRSASYVIKRAQAQRNCETHIQKILFKAARDILAASNKYRGKGKMLNEKQLRKEAQSITEKTEESISQYINAYAKASTKVLGIEQSSIDSFLSSEIFGKTTLQRNTQYLKNFADDIVAMIKAGQLMTYSEQKLLSAIRTGYKTPFEISLITKAQKKKINIETPSYGKGVFRNAYQNIVRNAKQVIAIAWGKAERQYGIQSGATAFEVHRGSTYPCPICDDQCAYIHTFRDPLPPFHVSCVCWVKFIYNKK